MRSWSAPLTDPALALYLVVLILAVIQSWLAGSTPRANAVVPYLAGGALLLGLRWWHGTDGPAARMVVPAFAMLGTGIGAWAVVTFLVALPGAMDDPAGFYRVKVAVTTPLGDHNTAAGLLLVTLVAACLTTREDRRWAVSLVVVTLGLVATLSRGAAVIALLVAVTALVARRPSGRLLAPCAVAVLAGVLGLAAWLGAAPPAGTEVADGPLGTSLVGRVDLAVRGVELGLDHPLVGVGLGRFPDHADDLPPPNDHAHQLLTHAFAEGGAPLLAVAGALPLIMLGRAWRRRPDRLSELALLGGGAMVLHAQVEILGGRLGYELLLAALLASLGRRGAAQASGSGRGSQDAPPPHGTPPHRC